MWAPLLEPGLALLNGSAGELRGFFQALSHYALHDRDGQVLWVDGDHGFNPYDFAELNLTNGHEAEYGATRLLVKRCMTPFQWYTTLSRLLPEKLAAPTALAVVNPFDRLWSTDELSDWEQEDYVRFIVPHLRRVAQDHQVPIVLGVDMMRWWRTHPVLAQATHDAAATRWSVADVGGRWRLERSDGYVHDPMLRRTTTLLDYLEEPTPLPVPVARRPRRLHRTRILYPEKP